MKPILILFLAILISGLSQAQTQKDFIVFGDLKGVEDGTTVTLFQIDGNVGTGVATDTTRNGHFSLRGKGSRRLKSLLLGAMEIRDFHRCH